MSIEGVITRLMRERSGSRPSGSIEGWRKILNDLVAGERAENDRLRASLNGVVEAARFTRDLPVPLSEAIEAARAALEGK
jgi:hypothetical protein